MLQPLKYHEGEIAVQRRAGAFEPADLEGNGLGTTFDSRAAAFLAQQPWAVVSALNRDRQIWTSLLHGPLGFLQVNDPDTLSVHATLPVNDPLSEVFQEESEAGMLVLDPRNRRRVRINGRAHWADGKLLLKTREVYGNCPKYIQRREVSTTAGGELSPATSSPALSSLHEGWIQRADTFFIGSLHSEAGVDCSHRGGSPGFVRILGERRLAFADYSGNNMFQTLGNLSLDSRAGLLFLDFETGHTLQLTGTASVVWDAARLVGWAGAQRLVEFDIHQIVARENASPLRWRFVDYSPFNPK